MMNPSRQPWYEWTPVVVLILLAAVILPYLNTLHVPFYFDDNGNIVDNPLVRDLAGAARGIFDNRGLAIFTFALNYHFGGLAPAGYHLTNLAIHAGSVLVVWLLLRRLIERSSLWPLFGALLFALHPLQTQAVTYVVQRMTCLSGLFFLLSIYLYIRARGELPLNKGALPLRHNLFYLAALLSGGAAVLTKQNAAVLPLVLLLTDYYFLPQGRLTTFRKRFCYLLPFLALPLGLTVYELLLPLLQGGGIWRIANPTSEHPISSLNYLVTEFTVIWIYIRLLFLPYGQVFDYSYPVVATLVTWKNLLALCGIAGLLSLAFSWRKSSPLVSFGIFWFFLTLLVESTIIPLDPINEHRLYVPIFGFVLIVIDLLRRLPWRQFHLPLMAAILLLLAVLTWQRNALWADPVAFFEDNLRATPGNIRTMVMLGNAYAAANRPEEGLRSIEQARRLDPRFLFGYTAMGKILIDQGQGAKAIPALLQGLEFHPLSETLNEYLGIAYAEAGDYQQSLNHFTRALVLQPKDASVYSNIGFVYVRLGEYRQAVEYFKRSLALEPESEIALANYASALAKAREEEHPLELLTPALNPENPVPASPADSSRPGDK